MEQTRPCEICGQPIDPERVEILPETRLCGDHAREIAEYGGEFLLATQRTSLGKAGSLKKNYGDVSVTRHRNFEAMEKLRAAYERRQG